ncbi:MAG: hypothetical protein SGI83_01035 [Bacteroidota bacterium]|nr:hypothetical protein [Bacteroidota bacterium]
MESSSTPVAYTLNKDDSFFRKRHTATVAFAVGLLLFLLPFAELKCGGTALMGNTGAGIAMGNEWKIAMGGNDILHKMQSATNDKETKNALKSGPNVFLLVAIVAGIFGLLMGFFNQPWRHVAGMCAGILCCIMLIAVMIQFKMVLRSSLTNSKELEGMGSMGGLIKISFTIWYYASLLAFAAAGFFKYKHQQLEMKDAIDRSIDFEFLQKKNDPPFI